MYSAAADAAATAAASIVSYNTWSVILRSVAVYSAPIPIRLSTKTLGESGGVRAHIMGNGRPRDLDAISVIREN